MYSLGAKLLVVCAGPRQPHTNRQQFLAPLTPSCISASPTGSITLVSLPREIAATLHLKTSTWVMQRGARLYQYRTIKQFLAPLPRNPVYKTGELHTIFYLWFLVLLVYFVVFLL